MPAFKARAGMRPKKPRAIEFDKLTKNVNIDIITAIM